MTTCVPVPALVEEQRGIRLRLLKQGYRPLPARGKIVARLGWPTMGVTAREIEEWALCTGEVTTAIQMTGDLAALDFDIDDPVSVKILGAAEAAVPALMQAPCRYGKGHKVMVLVRTDKPFGHLVSHVWTRDGGDSHRFEAFGSKTARYFSCFGPHTIGDLTAYGLEVKVAYEWLGGSPLTIRPGKLPLVTQAEVRKIIGIVDEAMEAGGWTRPEISISGDVVASAVSDIAPDDVFECADGERRTYEELAGYAHEAGGGARCSAGVWDPWGKNRTRCRIFLDASGVACVLDFATQVRHYPEGHKVRVAPEQAAAAFDRLSSKMAEAGIGAEPGPEEALAKHVEALLREWAFDPTGALGEQVVSLTNRSAPGRGLTGFKVEHMPLSVMVTGPRGGKSSVNPVDLWIKDPRRVTVAGIDYVPECADLLVQTPAGLKLNTYQAPDFGSAEPWGLDIWHAFLEHLIPDQTEREWFVNWLACKVKHPSARGSAVLFVSHRIYGAGRGSLFTILSGVFGASNCANVTASTLLGQDSQAAFNDWQWGTLIAFCDEITMNEPGLSARRRAYDRLKALVDPATRSISVNVKYGKKRTTDARTSLIIASNHLDALPLDHADRRFAVIRNGSALKDNPSLSDRLGAVREGVWVHPGFALAIREDLLAYPARMRDFVVPLATDLKDEMASVGEGSLPDIIRDVLHNTPGGLISITALRARVEQAALAAGLPASARGAITHEIQSMMHETVPVEGWLKGPEFKAGASCNKRRFFYRAVPVEGAKHFTREAATEAIRCLSQRNRETLGA